MQYDLGIQLLERTPQKDVLDQNGVRARVPCLACRDKEVGKFVVLDERIERNIHLCPKQMRLTREPLQRRNAKIFRALARGKSRQSQIYGVRARPKRRVCRLFIPCGGKYLCHCFLYVRKFILSFSERFQNVFRSVRFFRNFRKMI